MTTKRKITSKPRRISLDLRISHLERQHAGPIPRTSPKHFKLGFQPKGTELQHIVLWNPIPFGNPARKHDTERYNNRCYYTCFANDLPEGLIPDHSYYEEKSLRINLRKIGRRDFYHERDKAIENQDDKLYHSFLYLDSFFPIFTNSKSVIGTGKPEEYYSFLRSAIHTPFERTLIASWGKEELQRLGLIEIIEDKILLDPKLFSDKRRTPLFKIESIEVVDYKIH